MTTPLSSMSRATVGGAAVSKSPALKVAVERVMAGRTLSAPKTRTIDPAQRASLEADLQDEFASSVSALHVTLPHDTASDSAAHIVRILKRASTRIKDAFDPASEQKLYENIRSFVRSGRPIPLLLPLGGAKAPATLKTGHYFLGDLTEDIQLVKLAAIAAGISAIYKPSARIVILPDAPLHAADLGFASTEYYLHLKALQRRIIQLGYSSALTVVNTLDYLTVDWPLEVQRIRNEAIERLKSNDRGFRETFLAQSQSLQYSINTRDYGWTLADHVLVAGALGNLSDKLPSEARRNAAEVLRRTMLVTPNYIGVNAAIRSLRLADRVIESLFGFSEYVRLTVHAKPGEPQPMLAQSNAATRPMLLPMHSLPVRFLRDSKPRFASVFFIEALINEWTSVIDPLTGGLLYFETDQDVLLSSVSRTSNQDAAPPSSSPLKEVA